MALALGEVVLRLRAEPGFRVRAMPVRVEPGGRLFVAHDTLGYAHVPGRLVIHFPSGLEAVTTHGADGLRITRPPGTQPAATRGTLWIFGCSFTHGWSLSDSETYPWILQQALPDHEVVNFGVEGYGTVQSLIQFREALERRPAPDVAIVAYASFHDERNTFSRNRRKAVVPWNRLGPLVQPYARLTGDGRARYEMARVVYRELPLQRRLVLVDRLERAYNALEASWLESDEVTRAVFADFAELAEAHGVTFVVAGLTPHPRTRRMLDDLAAVGVLTVDIAFHPGDAGIINHPHSAHPSPLANRGYADRLLAFLEAEVLEGRSANVSTSRRGPADVPPDAGWGVEGARRMRGK